MFIKNSSKFACIGSLVSVYIIAFATFGEALEFRGIDIENGMVENSSSSRLLSIVDEDDSIVDENRGELEESSQNEGNEYFSWKYHPDDHGVYAHRSLMSTLNIQHNQHEKPDAVDESMDKKDAEEENEYEALKTVDYAEKEWNLMFRALDSMSDGFASSMLHQIGKQTNLLEEVISRLKPDCKRDINHIKESVKKHKLWALRMVDSNGKLPSGITYGRFSSPGDYEECLSVSVDEIVHKGVEAKLAQEHHKFHGKYCLLDFRLPLPPRPHDRLLSIHDSVLDLSNTELAAKFPEFKNYSAYASIFYEIGYLHAVCLPSSCDVNDLTKSLGHALEGLHIIVSNTVDCEVKYEGQIVSWTKAQWISLTLLAILFLNAAMATIAYHLRPKQQSKTSKTVADKDYDEYGENQEDNKLKRWAVNRILGNKFYQECFSIQKNFERLTKPDPRGLTFVHYTRIVAMALTVITHTAGMGTLEAITKPADAGNSEQIFRDFIPQMLANAFSSIQIFFFMAGFMLVISTYPSIKRDKGHINFAEYAIKRAIRLMPGLAATIALNFLWPLVVDGPMLSYFNRVIVKPCETNWWRTMAFLSNYDHVEKMCLRHSYFSASDYQLHVMAFPLLILLYKQPMISLAIAALLTIMGFVAQVVMVVTKIVTPFILVDYIDKEAFFNVVHYIHHPVWNHMSAFFYGFILGYFVVKQIRIDLSPKTIKRTWYIILPVGILSIFAPYFWNHYKRPIYRWQMILYVIIDRFVLLTTCAWLSYASMVLARKKPVTKKSIESNQGNLNLPNTITMDDQSKVLKESPLAPIDGQEALAQEVAEPPQVMEDLAGTGGKSNNKLTAVLSTTSIPRQRSSPNFMALEASKDKPLGMRPAISTIDMSSMGAKEQIKQQPTSPTNNSDPSIVKTQLEPPRARPPAPVSNLNTLCLVLSRLTFQLYLFNMVVLWVDVNHSKYYWFFSYYFIITKALAVYIASSLMAMVFFVTLESPCLTLYIMWVKARAQARVNRRTSREKSSGDGEATGANMDATNVTNINVNFNPKDSSVSPDSLKQGKLGGLQMRIGSPIGPTKPTFSFIDLSSPESENPSNANDKQTKI